MTTDSKPAAFWAWLTDARRWDRFASVVMLALILVISFISSAWAIADLAAMLGWEGGQRWLAVVLVDSMSLYAVREWLRPSGRPEVRSFARVTAIGMLATSIGFNIAFHLLDGNPIDPGVKTALTIVLGAVPPIVLFCAIHMFAMSAGLEVKRSVRPRKRDKPQAAAQVAEPRPEPKPEPTPAPTVEDTQPAADVEPEPQPEPEPVKSTPVKPRLEVVPSINDRAKVEAIVEEHGLLGRDRMQAILRETYGQGMNNKTLGTILREIREEREERAS